MDSVFSKSRDKLLLPAPILLFDNRGDNGVDAAQLFPGCQTVRPGFGNAGVHLLHEPGDTNLEKFIEIGTHDRQESNPFEQRVPRILGLLKHAAIKRKPAQLAVEESRL
jgi:hypothetical protein